MCEREEREREKTSERKGERASEGGSEEEGKNMHRDGVRMLVVLV